MNSNCLTFINTKTNIMKTQKGFFITAAVLMLMLLSATTISAASTDNKNPDEKKSNENFIRSEVMPSLMEGTDIKTSVESQIDYPEQAVARRIEGVVIIEFTIDACGSVGKSKVVKDIGGGCAQAALAVIKEMKFVPAVQNGYAVPCTMRVPIRFKLF
jgi:TonB family protein